MTTTTLYKIVTSELYKIGHNKEIVDNQGNLVFFDNDFQVMTKVMSYDNDVKGIMDHIFNGLQLKDPAHDHHFKKTFFYKFINRQINRQTIETFKFELMSTFLMNQDYINRIYSDMDKYVLQTSTSEQTNKQLSKEISQQINQQVTNQLDERLNSEHSKNNSTQDTTSNDSGVTSETSTQDTTQDNNQTVTGNTTTDNRQARSDLPQNTVNLDVNNSVMQSANENDISKNKQTNNQDTESNTTGNTSNQSDGTSSSESTSNTTGTNNSDSTGESTGRTESDSNSQTDGTSDSETAGETNTLIKQYQLDELFKTHGVLDQVMNVFDVKCFLQFW